MLQVITLLVVAGMIYYYSPAQQKARFVSELVDRNIEARGGSEAWGEVNSLRLTGLMDVGQGLYLPYILEQQRPSDMCLEFVFDGDTTVQCTTGDQGWKIVPFRGRKTAQSLTESELREISDSADLYGLLYNYKERGIVIEYQGNQTLSGQETYKLKINLPKGAVRWLYLDTETALEVKLEALRKVGGKDRRVDTFYSDWKSVNDLLISHRQETQTEGDSSKHAITVQTAKINPLLPKMRFQKPKDSTTKSSANP